MVDRAVSSFCGDAAVVVVAPVLGGLLRLACCEGVVLFKASSMVVF